jgi:putrescine transport system permease protein
MSATASTTSAKTPAGPRRQFDVAKLLLGLWSALLIVFLMVPIFYVIIHSMNGGKSFNIWKDFGGLQWYRELLDTPSTRDTLINSFKAAIGSTILALVIGAFAGVALVRRPGRWTKIYIALLALVMVTPEIIDGFALLGWFFERLDGTFFEQGIGPIRGGMLRMWIGHSLFSSAVVTLIVRARLQGLDESLEEAAADLGATPIRAFRQITLPLMAPALMAGAMLSFSFSLDNVIMSNFVGNDASTFPLYLLGTVKSSTKPSAGAGGVLLFAFTLAFAAIAILVAKRSGQSSSEIASNLAAG